MASWLSSRAVSITLCGAMSLFEPCFAQHFSPAATVMFREAQEQTTDLARYMYLLKATQTLPREDQQLALQMFATVENELGLYDEALRDFPLKSPEPLNASLPTPAEWKSANAVDAITTMAADHRLVMINEAHHDAHTRLLTLELLPRLRALGFSYLALEALSDKDTQLAQRGYAVKSSGTEYLREPTYGEIVRTAIKLGYILVPYDEGGSSPNDRESRQASNLYSKTFARDADAKVLVHAGYAHIDKTVGRLGNARPMATYLQRLSGIEPLSIEQTQFREQIPVEQDAYRQLVSAFPSDEPIVLINRATGKPWSASPGRYDANVLLPPSAHGFVESGLVRPISNVRSSDRFHVSLPDPITRQRPNWLARPSGRVAQPITAAMCRTTFPCVVRANLIDDSDDAIAADRYAFMRGDVVSKLYLSPGRYRLCAVDGADKVLSEEVIVVGATKVDHPKPHPR